MLMRGGRAAEPRAVLRGRAIAQYVLSRWWSEVRDKLGRPASLQTTDFIALLKRLRLSGKRAAPILNELLRAGAIVRLKDGRLKPVRQSYAHVQRDRKDLVSAAVHARLYLEALFGLNASESGEVRFIRIIESEPLIGRAAARVVNEFMEDEQTLLDRTTDMFSRRGYAAAPGSADAKRIVATVHLLTEAARVPESGAKATRKRRQSRQLRSAGRRSKSQVGWG
jgi:hypothetical protein